MLYFLIGYMGSGKTSLAKRVSKRSGLPWIDTDKEIEKQEGRTVAEIFIEKGEKHFRNLESQFIQSLDASDSLIVATGGGLPCFNNNIELINELGKTFYLQLSAAKLTERLLESSSERPLLANKTAKEIKDFIEQSLNEREPHYLRSHHVLNANIPFDRLTEEVVKLF